MSAITTSPVVTPLESAHDAAAAAILSESLGVTDAGALFAEARADEMGGVFAAMVDGAVAGVYILRRDGMANTVTHLAITPAHRRTGLGKMCLMDALFRSGRRPLVVTAPEEVYPFFSRVGFKIVGKRRQPDGRALFRLGWHAPRPGAAPGENC